MGARKPSPPPSAPFDQEAVETVGRLRSSFEAIISALPEPIVRAAELHRALKIDRVLGWRIYNVIRCTDPFAAARYVPGAAGVKIFLRAAEQQGVPPEVTKTAAAALADYQRLVRTHAGDRQQLEMMLAAQSGEGRADTDVAQRRMAFKANSYIWGVSAAVQLRTTVVGFSDTPGQVDTANLRGFVRLQRIRAGVRWPISWVEVTDDADVTRGDLAFQPLYDIQHPDPVSARLFLSDPPPEIERVRPSGGKVRHDLMPGPVGKTAAITCVTGDIVRRVGSYRQTPEDAWAGHGARVATPCELLIFDQFVHEDLFGRIQPEMLVYGQLQPGDHTESCRLPVLETVSYMGRATGVLHTPEVPHYTDMVRYVFERTGWDVDRFDVYRFRMEYPVVPSDLIMQNPLRPAED